MNYSVDDVVFKDGKFSIMNELRRWRAILSSLINYDVIHYNFGRSLAPMRIYRKDYPVPKIVIWIYNNVYARLFEMIDVWAANKLKRVTAVIYQGDDARQGDFCRRTFPIHFCNEVNEEYYTPETDKLKREHIKKFDRYADLIYSVNPDLLYVLPDRAQFIPYANVDPRDWKPVWSTEESIKVPHVIHSPTHREVKGTKYVLQAFEKLKSESVDFKYTLVENMSNAEARKIYESADLLVDQLLAGFYGGLSVELMALGKPSICYMRQEDLKFMPADMVADIPLINATPDTIYDVLKEWLTTKKGNLLEQGKKSRTYVENWHDPHKIAQRLIQDYDTALKKKTKH